MERTDLILTVLVSDLCGKSDFSFEKNKQLFSNPNFVEIKEPSQFKSEKQKKKNFKKSLTWKDLRKTASEFASSAATCVHWENPI